MPRSIAVRILPLALAGGVLADIVLPGNAPGLNIPILIVALLGAALVAAGRGGVRRLDPADAWLAPAAIATAGMVAVRADPWLVELDIVLSAALGAGAIASLGGARITRGLVPDVLAVAGGVAAAALVGAGDVIGSLRSRPSSEVVGAPGEAGPAGAGSRVRARLRRSAPVARGLLIAAPLVVLLGTLFASADAMFDRLVRSLLAWPIDIDLGSLAERASVVAIVAWLAAGLLALGADALPSLSGARWPSHAMPARRSLGAAGATGLRASSRVGSTEAATVLLVLDVLFAAFVVLQVAYLFGGRDTLADTGLTYSAYARRGFFELVAVAGIAGTIVVALDLVVGIRSRAQLVASLALLGLTAVVLGSAFLRLRLYQDAYGWTELRFVVIVAIGWLAVALAFVAGLVLWRRTQWTLHVLGVLTLAAVAGMNVVGPQAFVADQNLARAIDPALVPEGGRSGLDAAYLAALGDEAVPSAVAALDRLRDAADREAVDAFLASRDLALRSEPAVAGWPSWNAGRERARSALADWRARETPMTGQAPGSH